MNWTGPDLSGFGELVLEGSFKVHRVKKERAFFLFDKMLLIAKKRMEQFVYSTHIFVSNNTLRPSWVVSALLHHNKHTCDPPGNIATAIL